ncbi:uncharacterized protein LOC110710024 [Chenopodium quinoa]|uniref:uncharacterized protein LOC110710024 n=1 Tax=Chenopodium quinoa TaxID=63459 RepID=UPI000B773F9D|nr:uncharacterized protein LOC110710024 [Chenopodium quinoa]
MAHNKMLETQITQLANTLKESFTSSLPSQGFEPRKTVYSITIRSGKVLETRVSRKSEEDKKMSDSREEKVINVSKKRFLNMLREVHLSIPLTEAMTQSSRYSKFLKEILSGQRGRNDIDLVEVGKCYSALIHNDLPKKMKNPSNLSIPCKINGKLFQNTLCDLGAIVRIIPYSVFRKLKLGELLPTNMTLQLADRSIKFSKGGVEDVPLKIGAFTIPVDFIVLEIAEDDNIPIILGKPFLDTLGTLIDVKGALITLRVGNNKASFELKPMHESLSLVNGIMCMISSSTNKVLEVCDDVPLIVACDKISEENKEPSKLVDEEVIDIPPWSELYP